MPDLSIYTKRDLWRKHGRPIGMVQYANPYHQGGWWTNLLRRSSKTDLPPGFMDDMILNYSKEYTGLIWRATPCPT